MKYPETLPWELQEYMDFIEIVTSDNERVCQFWDSHEEVLQDAKDNAAYIVTACNLLPELVEMLEFVDDQLDYCLPNKTAKKISDLLAKVKQ